MKKILTLSLLLNSCALFADPYEPMPMPNLTSWRPFTAEELRILEDEPTLHGGRESSPGELPFSVYIGNCTASIIGPHVIMTAGHCRDTRESASFTMNGQRFTGKCIQHPKYSSGSWLNNDFSLCIMEPEIKLQRMASLKPQDMKVGDTIIMQGYGAGSSGSRTNIGKTRIVRSDDVEYTTDDSVKLGGGDSGGALLKDTNDLVNGPFYIVGINSRASVGGKQSYFNRVNLDRSQEFFKDVADDENVEICGINKDCYQEDPGPGPTPTPTPTPPGPIDPPKPTHCKEEISFVDMFSKKLDFFKNKLAECSK